jgi:GT2 family glycosyltransferase
MINGEKIGVGICTCARPEMFKKLFESLNGCNFIIDRLFIVKDSTENNDQDYVTELLRTWSGDCDKFISENNMGVAKSKNLIFKNLMDNGCDHIFLIEDDIYIKNLDVFYEYIKASKVSGIQHFNFSQHGNMNKTFDNLQEPNPRMVIDYGKIQIALYPHCVGAFSYYSLKSLQICGLMDERFYNACEHVDHTFEIIKHELHPPFWYFSDIQNSWDYLGDEEWSIEQSTISVRFDRSSVIQNSTHNFFKKRGINLCEIKLTSDEDVVLLLKNIKLKYARIILNQI